MLSGSGLKGHTHPCTASCTYWVGSKTQEEGTEGKYKAGTRPRGVVSGHSLARGTVWQGHCTVTTASSPAWWWGTGSDGNCGWTMVLSHGYSTAWVGLVLAHTGEHCCALMLAAVTLSSHPQQSSEMRQTTVTGKVFPFQASLGSKD